MKRIVVNGKRIDDPESHLRSRINCGWRQDSEIRRQGCAMSGEGPTHESRAVHVSARRRTQTGTARATRLAATCATPRPARGPPPFNVFETQTTDGRGIAPNVRMKTELFGDAGKERSEDRCSR
ncbi:hypothetical protein P0D88_23620 [Paraburkholderia sp. RL18-103-BIB-C]|uniref:hypothetical protein n=1 Tax=unclassified Paraburkholderia TaxID=2615204 RepID=UPI0038BD928C